MRLLRLFATTAATVTVTATALTSPATASAATVGAASASAATAIAGTPSSAPRLAPSREVSLRAAFERLHGHAKPGPRRGVVPPRDATSVPAFRAAASAVGGAVGMASSCTEPNCDLPYNGGRVEHSPKLYVVFWGPTWTTNTAEQSAADYLLNFFKGLGTASDSWSETMVQYTDTMSRPVFTGSVLANYTIDSTAPPSQVTPNDIAAEAAAGAQHFGISNSTDDQVIVVSQTGTCFSDGFAGSSCTPVPAQYCGWHSAETYGGNLLSFTNLPYQLDAGTSCGEDFINSGTAGVYDGFSLIGGHEFAESVTDPAGTGWYDASDSVSGGEIGDKCAWGGQLWGSSDPDGNITLPTGTFAVQSLWSNAGGGCVMSTFLPSAPTTVTTPLSGGGRTGMSISVRAGTPVTGAATLSGVNSAHASGSVTYDVYSDAACTTPVSVGSARANSVSGAMPVSAPVTLTVPGTYYWKVSYSGDNTNGPSVSTCGPSGAVETVTDPPTTLTASLSGGGKAGAAITVPSGTAVRGVATLSGMNTANATGTVTYHVYKNAKCGVVAATMKVAVQGGVVPRSPAVKLAGPRTYYWIATYGGDSVNGASSSNCGATKVKVLAPVAPSGDTVRSRHGVTSATVAVSTKAKGELLVAYVAGKGPKGRAQSATVSARGLKWRRVARSHAGRGDAEVWVARASGKLTGLRVTARERYRRRPVEITVIAYRHAVGIGRHVVRHAGRGKPSGTLTTSRVNTRVFAIGDDWAASAVPTPPSGQRLVRKATDRAHDTYWVQTTRKVTRKAGTRVRIYDIRPVRHPYNLVLVEIR